MSEKNPENQAKGRLLEYLRDKKRINPDGIIGLLAILAPQIRREFHQPYDPNFFDYLTIRDQVREGKIQQRASDDFPATESDIQKQFYYLQFDLRKKNIKKILDHEFSKGRAILEIGSGELDKRGESFISSSIRKDFSRQFSYCDMNKEVARHHQTLCPQTPFSLADITLLSRYYPEGHFDYIVGLNVLDTLSCKDLNSCLLECAKVLKRGGKIIHLMNLEPYVHAFYHNVMQDGTIAIPFIEGGVNRKVVLFNKGSINREGFDEGELLLLDYLSTLSGIEQERLWSGLHLEDHTSQLKRFASFGTVIDPMQYHIELLTTTLAETGFTKIDEDDEESFRLVGVEFLPRLDQQRIESGPFGIYTTKDLRLPQGSAYVTVYTHAVIAYLI